MTDLADPPALSSIEPTPAHLLDRDRLSGLFDAALDALAAGVRHRNGPLPSGGPGQLARRAGRLPDEVLPEQGIGDLAALDDLVSVLAAGSVDPADPACAGHLHCPPLPVAVVADAAVSTLNPSLDSWDQGPVGAMLESQVVDALIRLVGQDPERAAGVFTTGGTASNLMALLFARERAGRARGIDLTADGLAALVATGWQPVVFCSALAHFSTARAAGVLGLGERCVVPVAVDADFRMDPDALALALAEARGQGLHPLAVVATAGTTDLGTIDPLAAVADVVDDDVRRSGERVWLHVDAAYGAGALFSDRLRPLLDGVERADSVALDLHKYGWQPVAAGVLVTAARDGFDGLERDVAYLNPLDDTAAGFPSLLGRSLRTTRRPDAVKVAVTMRALGRTGIGTLVDRCADLARHAADVVVRLPRLELRSVPTLSTVVFRYLPADPTRSDEVNAELRRLLLQRGVAVVGRADLEGATPGATVHLKLTLLNPAATAADVESLLEAVVAAGAEVES